MQERIPTKSEVDFLIERIGIPAEGRLVKRLEIQAAIGREVSESRYRSIVNSWKKRLFGQYDVLMLTDHQGGYFAATPEERITRAISLRESAVMQMGRATVIAASADSRRLTEESAAVQQAIRLQISDAKLALYQRIAG